MNGKTRQPVWHSHTPQNSKNLYECLHFSESPLSSLHIFLGTSITPFITLKTTECVTHALISSGILKPDGAAFGLLSYEYARTFSLFKITPTVYWLLLVCKCICENMCSSVCSFCHSASRSLRCPLREANPLRETNSPPVVSVK